MNQDSGTDPIRFTTPAGYRRLQALLDKTRREYLAVCAGNEEAAAAGDNSVWHDNFAYEENQRRMHQLAARVREIENTLAGITLAPVARHTPERACLGARVHIRSEQGDEMILFIAGYGDGDPAFGRISYTSPMARAMLGKEVGEEFRLHARGQMQKYEILELLPGNEETVDNRKEERQ